MLPLHQAVSHLSHLGEPLAKTVIKAHILTGDDYMSKVGTKPAAVVCDHVQYIPDKLWRNRHVIRPRQHLPRST